MINNNALMEVLEKHRGDALVVPTMTATRAWGENSGQASRDISIGGAMGKASSFGLGLALSQPNLKVLVLDGDGSLEMNLGALTTISGKQPKNFYHFLLENGVYAITGGQPIPARDRVNFMAMARGAGYAAVYEFDDLEEFAAQIEGILQQDGPVFITIRSEPEIQNEPIGRRKRSPMARSTASAIVDMQEELGAV